jgi:2-phosphosulfolactate phosphatase
MDVEFALIPAHLNGRSLAGMTVVVFDVLRATTTITSAFASGILSVRAFADLNEMKSAAAAHEPTPITVGEVSALRAPGVDLGNSPGQFTPAHHGREIFMASTNGTKAISAARSASEMFVAALVNAGAAAKTAAMTRRSILLLGSGTNGEISMEDTIGAGAVCASLEPFEYVAVNDITRMALRLFHDSASDLPAVLRQCQGGRNIIKAGLEPDIDFAAHLNVFDIVGRVDTNNLVIRPM